MEAGIVVVGAGQAACQFAASVRQLGYQGALTVVGAEPHLPYQRPPLSKGCLQGATALADLLLRPASFYESIRCRLLLGRQVAALDLAGKSVRLDDCETLPYTHLVLATGAQARQWPGLPPSDDVFTLRSWDDAQALAQRLDRARRLAVVGAGYIGLEVAASARKRGLEVSVFEAAPRVLQRSVGAGTSALVEALHRSQGVALHLGVRMAAIRVQRSAAGAVLLETSAGQFTADALVVGIGAAPRLELARQAGLHCGQAIRVDAACRTSDPHVFAIGDCAEQLLQAGAEPVRLESVQNATDQAKCVAAVLAGKPLPAAPVPWFWSDQFGHRIQVAGHGAPGDEVVVRRGLAKPTSQSTWYLRAGRVTAVETVDAAEDFMAARQWIKTGHAPDPARLADPQVALRELAAGTA